MSRIQTPHLFVPWPFQMTPRSRGSRRLEHRTAARAVPRRASSRCVVIFRIGPPCYRCPPTRRYGFPWMFSGAQQLAPSSRRPANQDRQRTAASDRRVVETTVPPAAFHCSTAASKLSESRSVAHTVPVGCNPPLPQLFFFRPPVNRMRPADRDASFPQTQQFAHSQGYVSL